ncbi:hypothetical protein BJX68DRAFT_251631 [Aspergillus pseudodeflectus]|uniref:Beta-lactamase-like ARB-00930-like C-terminal domain-containing protein n=1 Tax=Aspergillus pseudodeflectus TaxID=176178 RepID=A0ABR4LB83_9EURO
MMVSSSHASTLFLLFSSVFSCTPCPLLGPAFPPFTFDTNDKMVSSALQSLTKAFDTLVATSTSDHGDVSPSIAFSIALFSSDPGNAEDEPFFWQYHHTAPALNKLLAGSHTANKDSIYRADGLTEIFTVWILLLTEDSDQVLDDPVTKYMPELGDDTRGQGAVEYVAWDEVTVGQLASHMSGLERTVSGTEHTGLPTFRTILKPCCGNGPKCSSSDFIRLLADETPVAAAGVTLATPTWHFSFLATLDDIFDVLGMTETSIFVPASSSAGIIPVSREVSGWLAHHEADEASIPPSQVYLSLIKDIAPAGQLNGFDVYTVLSNERYTESLYCSYLGWVPDFGVGFAILSADTEAPTDLNAHADIIGDVVLEALMVTAIEQAAENFGGVYKLSAINSNGTDFCETLAELLGIADPADLRQDMSELADNGTPTCVLWLNLDKLHYGGRALDEFVLELSPSGRAVG